MNVTSLSCSFDGQHDEFRHVTSNSIQIGPSYVVQFELRMGCNLAFDDEIDNAVSFHEVLHTSLSVHDFSIGLYILDTLFIALPR